LLIAPLETYYNNFSIVGVSLRAISLSGSPCTSIMPTFCRHALEEPFGPAHINEVVAKSIHMRRMLKQMEVFAARHIFRIANLTVNNLKCAQVQEHSRHILCHAKV
jgi:hypothetical protein